MKHKKEEIDERFELGDNLRRHNKTSPPGSYQRLKKLCIKKGLVSPDGEILEKDEEKVKGLLNRRVF